MVGRGGDGVWAGASDGGGPSAEEDVIGSGTGAELTAEGGGGAVSPVGVDPDPVRWSILVVVVIARGPQPAMGDAASMERLLRGEPVVGVEQADEDLEELDAFDDEDERR